MTLRRSFVSVPRRDPHPVVGDWGSPLRHREKRLAVCEYLAVEEANSPLIAGRVPVRRLMHSLSLERPVFHSEADFQHSFARTLWELDPEIKTRLEVRQGETREYLDLLAIGPSRHTAIEFKFWSQRWSGTVGEPPERYQLKNHAATDLARRNFVFDLARLERFSAVPEMSGLAVMVTNDASLWSPPRTQQSTRDAAFRVHEGRVLEGTLLWGGGDYPANTRHLAGSYQLTWSDYSELTGPRGRFRSLVVETQ